MKRRILTFCTVVVLLLGSGVFIRLWTGRNSTFSICFIDVGQGDAALVECDGRYMLIDGGDKSAGDKVYRTLRENNVRKLDFLVLSHLHADHIAGLPNALNYITKIGMTISNSASGDTNTFYDLEHELHQLDSKIMIPQIGDKYKLGSAKVEVIDVSAAEGNDSLVLLITYGKTRFLFTGDIEETAQKRISNKYLNRWDAPFEIDLIKMPHHGAYTNSLYQFLRTFMPKYAVISVGENNQYGHPDSKTLKMLDSKTWKPKVYRTDYDGDIYVQSNGRNIFIKTDR